MDPSTQTLSARAQFIATQNRLLPVTRDGLLAGYWRADMLPEDPSKESLESTSQGAFFPLQHDEGFPTLPDGRPFWHKWDHEPIEAFAGFEHYIELAATGPRYLGALLSNEELLHINPSLNLGTLQEYYHLYYWKERARAYDLYKEAAYRHIRTRRALQTDDFLYDKSTQLLNSALNAMSGDDFQRQLESDPKLALDLFKEMAKIRRVSAGLPAGAPADTQGRAFPDFEVTMRQVVEQGAPVLSNPNNNAGGERRHTFDERGRVIPNNNAFLRGALNDPQTAKLLQEVVLKISAGEGPTKRPRWFNAASTTNNTEPYEEDIDSEGDLDRHDVPLRGNLPGTQDD